MNSTLQITNIRGIDDANILNKIRELVSVFNKHDSANRIKNKYYEGNIPLSEVNLGIALPETLRGLEIGCGWGNKAVDVLAGRSMFDGFVGEDGFDIEELNKLMDANDLAREYIKACKDELKFGCTFATLSKDDEKGCKIRFHSPQTAAALWNGEKGRIDCGLAIIDSQVDETDITYRPSLVNIYTDTDVWVLQRQEAEWFAERRPHTMGRPLIEPMIWNATSAKPFGRSRLKGSVRRLIQGYIRTMANATIGLEFATSPQKYLLGVTDEQYDVVINQKFKQYIGSIIASTTNPDTGEKPSFGQLQQGTIAPHVSMLRALATQFSAETGLSVTDTGVINDANPSSSDAILAQSQTLVNLAEQLNITNGAALKNIAEMALAISQGKMPADLETAKIVAHFKNPAMPSIAASADAALKIASARQGFANTDTFLEMVGFSQADIRRIKGQEQRARGLAVINAEFTNEDQ